MSKDASGVTLIFTGLEKSHRNGSGRIFRINPGAPWRDRKSSRYLGTTQGERRVWIRRTIPPTRQYNFSDTLLQITPKGCRIDALHRFGGQAHPGEAARVVSEGIRDMNVQTVPQKKIPLRVPLDKGDKNVGI